MVVKIYIDEIDRNNDMIRLIKEEDGDITEEYMNLDEFKETYSIESYYEGYSAEVIVEEISPDKVRDYEITRHYREEPKVPNGIKEIIEDRPIETVRGDRNRRERIGVHEFEFRGDDRRDESRRDPLISRREAAKGRTRSTSPTKEISLSVTDTTGKDLQYVSELQEDLFDCED